MYLIRLLKLSNNGLIKWFNDVSELTEHGTLHYVFGGFDNPYDFFIVENFTEEELNAAILLSGKKYRNHTHI